ncbi:MAG TPA: (E)-4-hydroxy-3-methylbut-2-enyl-diphosphate synthase [Bacteroidia bacterium]|nr:(E)-4-hydroxy-3-methylbut-2-enyl-diphosphate synthase [Bacteroidia bacterium]
MENNKYCNSLTHYSRLKTREVKVGDVGIGGINPIRVQSMTTTDTMDTLKTVEQAIRIIEAGGELVRITAPSINEANNLENIKKELRKRGYNTPLVADIHFTPNAAEIAARIVEKVRVNPGNYADRKKFEHIEYTDLGYEEELERIRERFTPLVKICKEYGTAMRIGTNHGSLSDRIMSRYGDTPLGMVESAIEFLRICEENNFYDIVLSMKSSNPIVMVEAYRLLANKMMESERNYPLHLGVTEAGEGEDGRIKSSVGIGTLLEDGLGDTIRVSLTEDPEFEIPVAKRIVERYTKRKSQESTSNFKLQTSNFSPFEYKRRETKPVHNIGGHNVPRVIADFSQKEKFTRATFFSIGHNYSVPLDKWSASDQACDYIFLGDNVVDFKTPETMGLIYNYSTWKNLADQRNAYPLFTAEEFQSAQEKSSELNFVAVRMEMLKQVQHDNTTVFVLETSNAHGMAQQRRMFFELLSQGRNVPVIVKRKYQDITEEQLQLFASTDIGALLVDGFGDGVWLTHVSELRTRNYKLINTTSFGILQATRTRISKTDYISCPSCGRTLFELQETTARIRAKTNHLKGLKIAIMGCIVNGPGEMADADYGYVGTGVGKINLYRGKEIVRRNVPTDEAVDSLIELIRANGDWVEEKKEVGSLQ